MEHGDIEITQGRIPVSIEGEVLTMSESATRKKNGKVRVVVHICVTHVAAKKNHRVVKQTPVTVNLAGKLLKQISQDTHLTEIHLFQLLDLGLRLTVMAERMISSDRFFLLADFEYGRRKPIDH
ncbi:MAG: hypothetical protein ACJASX_000299 [Limisphaerales bacterium]